MLNEYRVKDAGGGGGTKGAGDELDRGHLIASQCGSWALITSQEQGFALELLFCTFVFLNCLPGISNAYTGMRVAEMDQVGGLGGWGVYS